MVKDGEFYLREGHIGLVREGRLSAGVTALGSLPKKLRENLLLIKDKNAKRAIFEDAEILALYAGKLPGTDGFSTDVKFAME